MNGPDMDGWLGEAPGCEVRDGFLYLTVSELLVNTKVSSGDYNRNQVYVHALLKPAAPLVLAVPVGELRGLDALRKAIEGVQEVVAGTVREGALELEQQRAREQLSKAVQRTGTGVKTSVTTLGDTKPGHRPALEASFDDPPEEALANDEGDF
jgi:hypothetical protein